MSYWEDTATVELILAMDIALHYREKLMEYNELKEEALSKPSILDSRHFRTLKGMFNGKSVDDYDLEIATIKKEIDSRSLGE